MSVQTPHVDDAQRCEDLNLIARFSSHSMASIQTLLQDPLVGFLAGAIALVGVTGTFVSLPVSNPQRADRAVMQSRSSSVAKRNDQPVSRHQLLLKRSKALARADLLVVIARATVGLLRRCQRQST